MVELVIQLRVVAKHSDVYKLVRKLFELHDEGFKYIITASNEGVILSNDSLKLSQEEIDSIFNSVGSEEPFTLANGQAAEIQRVIVSL